MRTTSTTDTCPLITQAALVTMAIGVASSFLAIVAECGELVRVCFGLLGVLGVVAAARLYCLGAEYQQRQQEVKRRIADYRARHSILSPETPNTDVRTRFEEALATRNRLFEDAKARAAKLKDEVNALRSVLKSMESLPPRRRRALRRGEVVTALKYVLAGHPQGIHRDDLLPLVTDYLNAEHDGSLVGLALRFREALSSDQFLEHEGIVRLASSPPPVE